MSEYIRDNSSSKSASDSRKPSGGVFSIIVLTLALIIGCLIVWHAVDVFLLAFASVLLGIAFYAMGTAISRWTQLPYIISLTAFLICFIGIMIMIFWLYAPLIAEQFQKLMELLPAAFEQLREIASRSLNVRILSGRELTKELFTNERMLAHLTSFFSFTFGTILGFILFFLVGIYIAYAPTFYVKTILHLIPPKRRLQVANMLSALGEGLRWWILGKALSMVIIGVLTFLGLWILKVPLPLILGLLAGILAFIPYLGPIISAIPAILIALTQSPLKALYVIVLYVVIHIVEGYFITPFIEQKTVTLPPGITIMTQILLAVLVGMLGLALASPLAVVFLVFLKQLYQRNGISTLHGKKARALS